MEANCAPPSSSSTAPAPVGLDETYEYVEHYKRALAAAKKRAPSALTNDDTMTTASAGGVTRYPSPSNGLPLPAAAPAIFMGVGNPHHSRRAVLSSSADEGGEEGSNFIVSSSKYNGRVGTDQTISRRKRCSNLSEASSTVAAADVFAADSNSGSRCENNNNNNSNNSAAAVVVVVEDDNLIIASPSGEHLRPTSPNDVLLSSSSRSFFLGSGEPDRTAEGHHHEQQRDGETTLRVRSSDGGRQEEECVSPTMVALWRAVGSRAVADQQSYDDDDGGDDYDGDSAMGNFGWNGSHYSAEEEVYDESASFKNSGFAAGAIATADTNTNKNHSAAPSAPSNDSAVLTDDFASVRSPSASYGGADGTYDDDDGFGDRTADSDGGGCDSSADGCGDADNDDIDMNTDDGRTIVVSAVDANDDVGDDDSLWGGGGTRGSACSQMDSLYCRHNSSISGSAFHPYSHHQQQHHLHRQYSSTSREYHNNSTSTGYNNNAAAAAPMSSSIAATPRANTLLGSIIQSVVGQTLNREGGVGVGGTNGAMAAGGGGGGGANSNFDGSHSMMTSPITGGGAGLSAGLQRLLSGFTPTSPLALGGAVTAASPLLLHHSGGDLMALAAAGTPQTGRPHLPPHFMIDGLAVAEEEDGGADEGAEDREDAPIVVAHHHSLLRSNTSHHHNYNNTNNTNNNGHHLCHRGAIHNNLHHQHLRNVSSTTSTGGGGGGTAAMVFGSRGAMPSAAARQNRVASFASSGYGAFTSSTGVDDDLPHHHHFPPRYQQSNNNSHNQQHHHRGGAPNLGSLLAPSSSAGLLPPHHCGRSSSLWGGGSVDGNGTSTVAADDDDGDGDEDGRCSPEMAELMHRHSSYQQQRGGNNSYPQVNPNLYATDATIPHSTIGIISSGGTHNNNVAVGGDRSAMLLLAELASSTGGAYGRDDWHRDEDYDDDDGASQQSCSLRRGTPPTVTTVVGADHDQHGAYYACDDGENGVNRVYDSNSVDGGYGDARGGGGSRLCPPPPPQTGAVVVISPAPTPVPLPRGADFGSALSIHPSCFDLRSGSALPVAFYHHPEFFYTYLDDDDDDDQSCDAEHKDGTHDQREDAAPDSDDGDASYLSMRRQLTCDTMMMMSTGADDYSTDRGADDEVGEEADDANDSSNHHRKPSSGNTMMNCSSATDAYTSLVDGGCGSAATVVTARQRQPITLRVLGSAATHHSRKPSTLSGVNGDAKSRNGKENNNSINSQQKSQQPQQPAQQQQQQQEHCVIDNASRGRCVASVLTSYMANPHHRAKSPSSPLIEAAHAVTAPTLCSFTQVVYALAIMRRLGEAEEANAAQQQLHRSSCNNKSAAAAAANDDDAAYHYLSSQRTSGLETPTGRSVVSRCSAASMRSSVGSRGGGVVGCAPSSRSVSPTTSVASAASASTFFSPASARRVLGASMLIAGKVHEDRYPKASLVARAVGMKMEEEVVAVAEEVEDEEVSPAAPIIGNDGKAVMQEGDGGDTLTAIVTAATSAQCSALTSPRSVVSCEVRANDAMLMGKQAVLARIVSVGSGECDACDGGGGAFFDLISTNSAQTGASRSRGGGRGMDESQTGDGAEEHGDDEDGGEEGRVGDDDDRETVVTTATTAPRWQNKNNNRSSTKPSSTTATAASLMHLARTEAIILEKVGWSVHVSIAEYTAAFNDLMRVMEEEKAWCA